MTNRARGARFLTVPLFAAFTWACGGQTPSVLTAPTVAAPTTTQNYTLTGVVSAGTFAASTPVEGVLVEETHSHQTAMTDAKGVFAIANISGPVSISVSKSGYFTQTFPERPSGANDFQLLIVPIPPLYALSGVVSEMTAAGPTPVEGVLVEGYQCGPSHCDDERSITDRDGHYSLALYAGQNSIWVTKEGYEVDGMPPSPSCDNCNIVVTLDSDTRFDLHLVTRR